MYIQFFSYHFDGTVFHYSIIISDGTDICVWSKGPSAPGNHKDKRNMKDERQRS